MRNISQLKIPLLVSLLLVLLALFVAISLLEIGYNTYSSKNENYVSKPDNISIEIAILFVQYLLLLNTVFGYIINKNKVKLSQDTVLLSEDLNDLSIFTAPILNGTFLAGLVVLSFYSNYFLGIINLLVLGVLGILISIIPIYQFKKVQLHTTFPLISFKSSIYEWLFSPTKVLAYILIYFVAVILI